MIPQPIKLISFFKDLQQLDIDGSAVTTQARSSVAEVLGSVPLEPQWTPLVETEVSNTSKHSPSGLSASWHASSTHNSQYHISEGHALALPHEVRHLNGGGCSEEVLRSSSMNGRSASTSGRLALGGANVEQCQQNTFIGWPRAVVVHSELRSEVGFAGTAHEVRDSCACRPDVEGT